MRTLFLPDEDLPVYGPSEPVPLEPEEVRAAARMRAHLLGLVRASPDGGLSFARFMEEALYAPGLGYYTGERNVFGPGGDYTTASDEADAYAALVAHKLSSLLAEGLTPAVLEIGPGSGRFAADLVRELALRGLRLEAYHLLEPHPAAEARQRAVLGGEASGPFRWCRRAPPGFRGLVLAHEVFDAQPCERFLLAPEGVRGWALAERNGSLAWRTEPAAPPLAREVAAILADLEAPLPVPYVSEAAMAYGRVFDLLEGVDDALFLVLDYGHPRRTYYHPERRTGTLRCHHRHRVHDEPLRAPGVEDITAHVDFTRLAEVATGAGWTVEGFVPLARFAVHGGSLEAAAADGRRRRALERLVDPALMGEVFKVMALARGARAPLPDFGRDDRTATL